MRLSSKHISALFISAAKRELINRDWLLDAMTVVSEFTHNVTYSGKIGLGDTITVEAALQKEDVKQGQVVGVNDAWKGIVLNDSGMALTIAILSPANEPIFRRLDTFSMSEAPWKQYFAGSKVDATFDNNLTTVGRFLENCIVLQFPTDFKVFDYDNSLWTPKSVLKKVTNALQNKQIDIEQYRCIIDNFFYLNNISEIGVPSMTVKSLMTDPRIPEVKKKFIEEHKDQMNDPFVIKELEDMLEKMDKEYLADDPSVTFFDGLGKKSYQIHRKKLFLMVGGIPAFDESTGKYDFNPNSLMDGWTVDVLPSIANESRKGSYERGRETAKGGAETKLVMRVFQDLSINMDDCGTKRTLKFDFANLFNVADFIGRTARVGGFDVVITPENVNKFVGKVVDIYSPMTCENKYNLCYKCCGQRCKELGVKVIGIQTVKITSQFMQTSMKNMHGTVLQTKEIKLEDVLL